MGFNCGIVGLPNVGKSTIFNALTAAGAQAANFPFCTIEPNVGVVPVPDGRLKEIAARIVPQKLIPAQMEFVDIAGLVKGASKGEGLGNQFLGHIKSVDAIAHVVRCFEDDNVTHVSGKIDPIDDLEVINLELILADLQTVEKSLHRNGKMAKAGDKEAKALVDLLERLQEHMESEKPARTLELNEEDAIRIKTLHLISSKPVLYVCNVAEEDAAEGTALTEKVAAKAAEEGCVAVVLSGKIEEELSDLDDESRLEFLQSMGLEEPGLNRLIRAGFDLLGLQTYFTAGEKEVRAWTIKQGDKAPQAAGVIHTDFEKGFIRAQIYHYDDLIEFGTEAAVKDKGKLRAEGKEYVMHDGDIVHFLFNV